MKKNPGRKERRQLARRERRAAGRERAKYNERLQKKGNKAEDSLGPTFQA